MSGGRKRAPYGWAILVALACAATLASPAAATHRGCGLLGLSLCPHYDPPPDPGGDENANVPIPPPGGKLAGFGSNLPVWGALGLTADEEYDLADATGANAYRVDVFWSLAEPSPPSSGGGHSYSGAGPEQGYVDQIDARYAAIRARGMKPILTFHSAPGWAQESSLTGGCTSACWRFVEPAQSRIGAWWDFARFLAQRYPEAAFEVWNEPNVKGFYRPAINSGRYLRLYRTAYDAIKSVRPGAAVLTGGILLLQNWQTGVGVGSAQFLGDLYRLGLRSSPDLRLSLHSFPGAEELGGWSFNATVWAGVVDLMRAIGDGGREVWVTEMGMSTAPEWLQGTSGPRGLIATPAQQRDVIRRAYNRLLTMDTIGDPARRVNIKAVLFYSLVDYAEGGVTDPNYGYGFLRSSLAPKPVFCWAVGNEPPDAPQRTYPGC